MTDILDFRFVTGINYLPKRTHFGYDVMIHASMLAALDYNNNVNREQVCKPQYFS